MLLASALTETLTLTVLFVSCSPCLSYLEVEVRLRVPAVQLLLGNQIVQRTLLHYHTLSALIPKQMQDSYAGKHSLYIPQNGSGSIYYLVITMKKIKK